MLSHSVLSVQLSPGDLKCTSVLVGMKCAENVMVSAITSWKPVGSHWHCEPSTSCIPS